MSNATALRAEALLDARRPEEARSLLAEVLASDPDNWRNWCLLARASLACGDKKAALSAADRAVGLAPDAEWPHRLRSVALRPKKPRESITAATHAVAAGPNEWRAFRNLAEALMAAKQLQDARAPAFRAVELAPSEALAHTVLGRVLALGKDHASAEACFARALALDPSNPDVRNEAAIGTLAKGDFAGAATEFSEAIRSDPRMGIASTNFDLSIRLLIHRTVAICFLLVVTVGRILALSTEGNTSAPPVRLMFSLIGVAVAAILGYRLSRFFADLPANLRAPARRSVRSSKGTMTSLGSLVVTSIALILTGVVPSGAQAACIVIAASGSWIAWLFAPGRRRGDWRGEAHRISGTIMVVIGLALVLLCFSFLGLSSLAGPDLIAAALSMLLGITAIRYGVRRRNGMAG